MPKLIAAGAGVVAISVDPPEVSAKLHAALGLPFPLASDPEHVALEALGVVDPANEIAKERPTTDEVLTALRPR